ncbi:hypothetical protein GCM10027422_27040 [Hymenobacter arcticus]
MRKLVLFATLFSSLAACHKSDDGPSLDFGAGDGFSYRDGSNYPAGAQDPTDWTTDATWSEQEKALFADAKFDLNAAQTTDFTQSNWLYPNPAAQSSWLVNARKNAAGGNAPFTWMAVIVRGDFQVAQRFPAAEAPSGYIGRGFDYAQLGLHPGERYRLYYVFYNNAGLLCKGHGDIRYDK